MSGPPDGIPSQADFGLMTAQLAKMGATPPKIMEWVGNKPDGRTRQEIVNQLNENLAMLQKP